LSGWWVARLTLGRLIDVGGMVALRAQVRHSELPPKGVYGSEGGHHSDEARTSPDGESVSYLGNLHNSVGTSVLLRVAHFSHSPRRTGQPSELDNTWILDVDI
jgi:hypothetical protein